MTPANAAEPGIPVLFEQISSKLRRQLPELIDSTLREHFDAHDPRERQ